MPAKSGRLAVCVALHGHLPVDAGVRNRWVNVLMRVRIIFISPPQHLQRIAGRDCCEGRTARLRSCTNGISLLLECRKPKLRAQR